MIVDGYLYQRALFSQKKDTQVKYAASDKKTQGRRVGIYASDDVMERLHALPKASYVRVMGKIWDCESMQTPETLMLVGYCHYTGGPTLNAVTIEDVKAPK